MKKRYLLVACLLLVSLLAGCGGGGGNTGGAAATTAAATTQAAATTTEKAAETTTAKATEAATTKAADAATTKAVDAVTTKATTKADEQAKPAEPEWDWQIDTSPFAYDCWYAGIWGMAKPNFEAGWGNTPISKVIQDTTGVTINFDNPIAPTGENELLAPMIASGTYPETLIIGGGAKNPLLKQMADSGAIYIMSELIDTYAPRLYELASSQLKIDNATPDGRLLSYVSGFQYDPESLDALRAVDLAPSSGGQIIFVRGDVLRAFGKDDITTLDEYSEFLHFARENFPDLEPIRLTSLHNLVGGGGSFWPGIFGIHLSGLYPNGDQIQLGFRDPKFLDYMRFWNGLYLDGVITDNMLADTAQSKDEKYLAAKYASMVDAVFGVYNTMNTNLEKQYGNKDLNYVPVGPPLKPGVDFKVPTIRGRGGTNFIITKNAKQPDRIVRFLEYLLTDDAQVLMTLGIEGDSWEWKGNRRVLLPEPAALIASDLEAYTQKYDVLARWAWVTKTTFWSWYCDDFLTPPGDVRVENNKRIGPYVHDIWEEGFSDIPNDIESGSDLDIIKTKIKDLAESACVKMAAAKNGDEFMKIYDGFIAEIDKQGAAKLEAQYTIIYKENIRRLGL